MIDELAELGYEITVWEGGEPWQDAQFVAQEEFEHNAEIEYPRLPTLVILGSAYETVVQNQVGTVYYQDQTGECPLGICASDAKIVDFDGDNVPDMPWTRVLGRSQTDIRNATEAAIRYLRCEAFGPQRAVILDGDIRNPLLGCVETVDPRSSVERIREQLEAGNTPATIYHESDHLPCDDWSIKRNVAITMFSNGLSELVGLGYFTDRRHMPGGFLQDKYAPKLQITDLPYPQLFVAELFACGSGDEDALNPLGGKLLVEAFTTSDPNYYPTAIAWIGNRRGGYLRNHMVLAEAYFANKLAADGTSTIQEILFNTIRELSEQEPGMRNHLLLTTAFGWPTWPASRCVPPAVVTASSSNQAHPSLVAACPQGDADTLIVSVDFDEGATTRDFLANEVTLDVSDFASTVFDADGILPAGSDATAPLHKTSVRHSHFGACSNETADILLNSYPLATQATVTIHSPDLNGSGAVDLGDFALFGQNYPLEPAPAGDCRDFNGDGNVNLGDFQIFGLHNGHSSPYSPVNTPAEVLQSDATVALRFTEEYPTATTHKLFVDVDVQNFGGVTTSLFALVPGGDRLVFAEWRAAESTLGTVMCAPVTRDGAEQVYFGALVSESFAGSSSHLGQLVFDVAGTEPIEITEGHFVLAYGEVLQASLGSSPVSAQMTGVLQRTFDPAIARVYHNRLEQNFPNPFNPTTTLAFSIKDAGRVSLTVYDVAGRRVRQLVNERKERGAYKVVWDGQNDTGQTVASGVYFYKMVAGSFTGTRKMTILK